MDFIRKKTGLLLILLITSLVIIISTPAFAADKAIAKLTGFSGELLIRTQGEWGTEPKVGLPLYSEDKIVTKTGTAVITFNDGGVMDLKNNSNLKIIEKEETKGIFRKVKVVKRSLRLLLGKVIFKSGTGIAKAETRLESATMVCGLRGTEVIFSIGADNQPYLFFTEGGAAFTIGDFITGEAPGVPPELANQNPAQRAAFAANAAAAVQKNIAAKKAAGVAVPAEAEQLAQALYDEANAYEEYYEQHLIEVNNPDAGVVAEAAEAAQSAQSAIDAARNSAQDATTIMEDSGTEIPDELQEDVETLIDAVEQSQSLQSEILSNVPEGYSPPTTEEAAAGGAAAPGAAAPGTADIFTVDVTPASPI